MMLENHSTGVGGRDSDTPAFFFVSAHGGAGASTLSAMIAPAEDAGHKWPIANSEPYVYVVSDATMQGLDEAHEAIVTAPSEIHLLGLVVVRHDSSRLSRPVVAKLSVLKSITKVFEAPYLKWVRESTAANLPRWEPGVETPGRRRAKNCITPQFAALGDELCREYVRSRRHGGN